MNLLNKASIASAVAAMSAVTHKSVNIPSLNGDVNIKVQTVAEREAMEELYSKQGKGDKQSIYAITFAHVVVNDKGEREFGDKDIKDIANYPAHIVMPVWRAYNDINGITSAKVDEAEKN